MTVLDTIATRGGATVEIHDLRYTAWDACEPDVEVEIDGFGWECQGCGTTPGPNTGYATCGEARDSGQRHADHCETAR